MSEEEKTEQEEQVPAEQTQEKTAEWEAERQRIDQAEANVKKLADQLSSANEEKSLLMDKLSSIEAKLTKEAKKDGVELDDVDDDLVGSAVSKNFKVLQQQLAATKEQLNVLMTKASAYEEERQQSEAEKQKTRTIDKICKPLDKRYGAKFRNEAQELANQKIANKEVSKPNDALDARDLLAACYKELHDAEKAKEPKKAVPTDTGIGGAPFTKGEAKTGTIDEVFADMKKSLGVK
jgi:hypothetical protein